MEKTNRKKEYNTLQRKLIQRCLSQQHNGQITAEQLHALLSAQGFNVGMATIYRTLDKMVKSNQALKYTSLDETRASYQYIGENELCKSHYHLVCLSCGEVAHLSCDTMWKFEAHIKNEHNFDINNLKTAFYGYCKSCTHKNGDNTDV